MMIRYHRMRGDQTLWVPGEDHAGIATQAVVEKQIAKEGTDRHAMGREEFVERVWEWVRQYKHRIQNQHRRLGASCDWTRERFTLDEGLSQAVREVFVRLYEEGLAYRGERIINWCPRCMSSISDLEVDVEDTPAKLYYVRYPIEPLEGETEQQYITVATTRPETILGDTAVAVNPRDPRYQALIGRFAILPVLNRRIPIVGDDAIEPEFGTGAMKVTPAHDPTDFEIGNRHDLPRIQVIGFDAKMTAEAGPYAGQDRFECRANLLADLEKLGLFVKADDYVVPLGHCQRCGTVIEPLISKQWFVKMGPLATPALDARQVWADEDRAGALQQDLYRLAGEHPRLEHLAPALVGASHPRLVLREWAHHRGAHRPQRLRRPAAASRSRRTRMCWIRGLARGSGRSARWAGRKTPPTCGTFYPTSVMETGYDIIFFWVARMAMAGIHFIGMVPFQTIYLHGLVRDEQGRKMSKSLGNVIDPIEVMDQYGTDALRFTLATSGTPGNDMKLVMDRIVGNRNFANKIWNAARFVIGQTEDVGGRHSGVGDDQAADAGGPLDCEPRAATGRRGDAADRRVPVWRSGTADLRLPLVGLLRLVSRRSAKVQLQGSGASANSTARILRAVLDRSMRLLHPFMPYVTEEVWQHLYADSEAERPAHRADRCARGRRPTSASATCWRRPIRRLQEIITSIRDARKQMGVEAARRVPALIAAHEHAETLRSQAPLLEFLARTEAPRIEADLPAPEQAVAIIAAGVEVYLPLAGLIDISQELARIDGEIAAARQDIERSQKMLANEQFTSRAKPDIVQKEREKLAGHEEKLAKLQTRRKELE